MDAIDVRRNQVLTDTLRRFVRRGARSSISKLLAKVRPEDLGGLLRGLTPGERLAVFRIAVADFPDSTGSVLTEMEPHLRTELLERLEPGEVAGVLELLAVDDAVSVVESLPSEVKDRVLAIVDLKGVTEVQSQLTYEDDSAGRIMTREFFSLPESTLVREAIATIQDQGEEIEMIFYLYVVDLEGLLVGVTSLRQILLSPPDKSLRDIAQRDMIKVDTTTDQEEVAQLAARYDLLAIPVVDEHNKLLGIVTVDDIVDIVKEEATEDFFKMVGTNEDELLYQERAWRLAGIRLPWLLINLVGLLLTGILFEHFQVRFQEALFLLTFVPVIMGMGGNIGTQTSTITVRGLATGQLRFGDRRIGAFLWSQVRVGALLGLATAALVAIAAAALESGNVYYAIVVSVSLFMAILVASFNGAIIPVLFEKFGIDPAVAAGPLVTTSNDITGILIYFGFAGLLIEFLIR
ncbi:MAG: magnesium transporter [Acidobacteriota bacterium]